MHLPLCRVLALLVITPSFYAFLFSAAPGPLQHDRLQQGLRQCTPSTAASPGARVPSTILLAAETGVSKAADAEKFDKLITEMLASSDLPTLALEKADSFDYHFMSHLMQRLQTSSDETEIAALNQVGEAVNFAMQQRLAKADFILRGILKSGDLKVMEAKMRKHLKANELDMAFDVILNMNIQQARADDTDGGNDAAANILQHLATMLSEERDKRLSPPTRLLRMLLRAKDEAERQGILLEKLVLANPPKRPPVLNEETGEEEEQEPLWGVADTQPEELAQSLKDFLEEIKAFEEELEADVVERARNLQAEIDVVVKACA